jgi:hypothetical protein
MDGCERDGQEGVAVNHWNKGTGIEHIEVEFQDGARIGFAPSYVEYL